MLGSKLKKAVLGLMTVFFLAGGALACERLPTEVQGEDDNDPAKYDECILINGMLHCPD